MVVNVKKLFIVTLCALFFVGFAIIPAVTADTNPFAKNDSDAYITLVGSGGSCGGEGKCGEGKCGGEKKSKSKGKCGEGKCGGEKKIGGKSNDDKSSNDGSSDDKSSKGKCGEGKCGEGKCGS